MPFQRYLAADPSYPDYSRPDDPAIFSSNVHFQLPGVIIGAPTLAPGGGAEVLPPGYLPHPPADSLTPSWWSDSPYDRYSDDDFASVNKYHPSYPPAPPTVYRPSSPLSSYAPSTRLVRTPVSATRSPYVHLASQPPLVPLPSSIGLPVYSTSGFDFLSILSRVAARPDPKIHLGPVDLSCSFVVVDIRRYDSPIVYASPSFCRLTGYAEQDVIGRNCRFLQAPDGRVQRGEPRRHTGPDAVAALKSAAIDNKECQTTIINYRKGGNAFINLVTIIPVPGGIHNAPDEQNSVAYFIGFQVDLAEQPGAILQKLRDGSYLVDYSRRPPLPSSASLSAPRNWRAMSAAMSGVSTELHTLISDPAFFESVPAALPGSPGSGVVLSSALTAPASVVAAPAPTTPEHPPDPYDGNKPLNLLLLATAPDFLHVVSLKGAFLYVAPAVKHVLGYEPAELIGRALADFCLPADVIPLTRELKESSVTPGPGTAAAASAANAVVASDGPRKVDLLFRIRNKAGELVWLECRGRLHAEPGKGRKAIILSGRVRNMPSLEWGPVERAGGLAPANTVAGSSEGGSGSRSKSRGAGAGEESDELPQQEFWGLVSTGGTWLFVGHAIGDVLGWGATEVIGRTLGDFVGGAAPSEAQRMLGEALTHFGVHPHPHQPESHAVNCEMKRKDGSQVLVRVLLYSAQDHSTAYGRWPQLSLQGPSCIPSASPVVCQVRLIDMHAMALTRGARLVHRIGESVFEELEARRGSSWQYELQQLKFANERLREEAVSLEAAIEDAMRLQKKKQQQQQQPQHPQQQQHRQEPHPDIALLQSTSYVQQDIPQMSYTSEVPQYAHGWKGAYTYDPSAGHLRVLPSSYPPLSVSSLQSSVRLPMKRSWDGSPDHGPT